ncbi:MAG TPA: M23 family metallopeptidase [Thermoanaerobaculaceae bacterium]|nr:M23 family metallopeptidase [Thermoanaerobaculaceae bacterium]
MGLNDDTLWEVQWHPGSSGSFRRLVLTRRGLRGALIGLGLIGILCLIVMSALPVGVKGFLTSFTVEAAQRENRALRLQGEAVREQVLQASLRAHDLGQKGRRVAWAFGAPPDSWREPFLPPPGAGQPDEEIVTWLSGAEERLEALERGLVAVGSASLRCPMPSIPTGPPVDRLRAVPVSLFGWRQSPFTGKTVAQYGTILAAPEGEAVRASGGGRVVFAGGVRERRANEWTRLGNIVVIDHGGDVVTIFGHLRDVLVKRGQNVARGDKLGTVGESGWTRVPALYYELRWPLPGGSRPIDPGLVTIAVPVEDLDARLADPTAGLPTGWPLLEHLVGSGAARGPAHRPVRHDPVERRSGRPPS